MKAYTTYTLSAPDQDDQRVVSHYQLNVLFGLVCQLLTLPSIKHSLLFLLQKVTEEKYEIKVAFEEAAIKIITTTDPKVVVTITLTSPVMREGDDAENGSCFLSLLYTTTGPLISPL